MFTCDGKYDIVVYRRGTFGWFHVVYKKGTYTEEFLHDGGAWLCNECYILVPSEQLEQ